MADLHYDAFISYRHGGIDQYVAEQIHKRLETFKLPAAIVKEKKAKGEKTKIERVFRDQEELPLSDNLEGEIVKALENSDNLIVVCTPRFSESIWCLKEVETFIKLHGRKNIYAVLVEGEPDQSFPKYLLTDDKGQSVEPLAADFRGKDKKEINKKMNLEMLRLVAPIFGLNFDDLRQRHKERRARAIFRASMAIAVLAIAFGAFCGYVAIKMAKQNELIMEQNNAISTKNIEIATQAELLEEANSSLVYNQALALARQSEDLLSKGDRLGAIDIAYSALTEYEGIEMPFTAEANRALTNALYCYATSRTRRALMQFEMDGVIEEVIYSDDGRYIMLIDNTNTLKIIDSKELDYIHEVHNVAFNGLSHPNIGFLDDNAFYYYLENDDRSNHLIIESITQNKVLYTGNNTYGGNLYVGPDEDSFLICEGDDLFVYSKSDYKLLDTWSLDLDYTDIISSAMISDNKIYAYTTKLMEQESYLYSYDLEDQSTKQSQNLLSDYLAGWMNADNNIYIVSNEIFGSQYLYCIDKDSLKINWSVKTSIGSLLAIHDLDDCIGINSDNSYFMYDKTTGQEIFKQVLPDKSIGVRKTYVDDGATCVVLNFFSDGTYYYINGTTKEAFSSLFVFMDDYDLDSVDFTDYGAFGVPYKGTSLLYISQKAFDYLEPVYLSDGCDSILSAQTLYGATKTEYINTEKSIAKAEEIGLENSAIVSALQFTPDEKFAIVSYLNYDIKIYNIKSKEITDELSNELPMITYIGEDKDGRYYFGGNGSDCIAINDDGKIEFIVENLVGLDNSEKESKMIVYFSGYFDDTDFVAYPIFTKDRLLMMADTVKETYSH